MYAPQNDLSKVLLKSIPRRVFVTLESLGEDLSRPGTFQQLTWEFTPEGGTIAYRDPDDLDHALIEFTGDPIDASDVSCNLPLIEFIEMSLPAFTEKIENPIYDELELLRKEKERLSAYEFPRPSAR